MRQKIVGGNWKMNGSVGNISILLQQLLEFLDNTKTIADCLIFPPSIYLPLIEKTLQGTSIQWGAQNVYPKDAGAYTGELSAPMLKDYHCKYVLVGHSERRHLFNEDEKFVAAKFHHVKEHGMIPVFCVGETLAEREKGLTQQVLTQQLLAVTDGNKHCFQDCVIAYEPVWAIGTGQTASPEDVQAVHSSIRALVAELDKDDANLLPIIYGGSVNEKNAHPLFSMPDVDGGLIGGASLHARQFVEIISCIN